MALDMTELHVGEGMFRKSFKDEIERVKDEVLLLGSMTEQAICDSIRLFILQPESTHAFVKGTKKIPSRYHELKEKIIAIIATQQPTAHDLRVLAGSLEISAELKRMGDYAREIVTTRLHSRDQDQDRLLDALEYMAREASGMLYRAMIAYLNEDISAVYAIARHDSVVDALYQQLYYELLDYVAKDAGNIENLNRLLFVAHNLERFADRVTNICERIIFMSTGEIKEFVSTKERMDLDPSPGGQTLRAHHLPVDEDTLSYPVQ